MKKLLLIDNYDSFTYNILQYIGEVSHSEVIVDVVRNDAITVGEIASDIPDYIVISPGPCTPDEAGISVELVRKLAGQLPILGVCLGHQAIGQAFGGRVSLASDTVHGKSALITHNGAGIFRSLPSPLEVGRYHSLAVLEKDLPKELLITARTSDGEVMALEHTSLPHLYGVQFHPESILTPDGKSLLKNFLELN